MFLAKFSLEEKEREHVLILGDSKSDEAGDGYAERNAEYLIIALMHPFPCRVPWKCDGDKRVQNKKRGGDEAGDHEESRHFLSVYFPDDIGREEDEREREHRDRYVEAEYEGHYLEAERVGRKEGCEVDRERDDDLSRIALVEYGHMKAAF